jgi:hypothetical protein
MRKQALKSEFNFKGGLITEKSGLNFPEDACTETFDCVFEDTGKVTRRFGFEYEDSSTTNTVVRDGGYVTEYVWEAVGGDGSVTFVVTQYGDTIRFYKVQDPASASLVDGLRAFTIDMDTYAAAGAPDTKGQRCQYASGNGYLFITHPYCDPIYVQYNSGADTITVTEIAIEIRDVEGIDDSLALTNRPGSITDAHRYNLYNQGWGSQARTNDGTAIAYVYWDNNRADYPSNADIWWLMKRFTENGNEVMDVVGGDNAADSVNVGNSPAPKGHYILSAFSLNREVALETDTGGSHTITTVSSSYFRPSTCAFHAGRIFYSGVTYPKFNSKIYFSQILEKDDQVGKCYQSLDPSAEHSSDLLPSDGGVISINDVGNIVKLISVQNALLVFATNGTWAIVGSEGTGFRANDYTVVKLSTLGARSPNSFVIVNGMPMWWNFDGIYTIQVGATGTIQEAQVISITDQTIQSFFDDIPAQSIQNVKGAYNSLTNVVQWVYRSVVNADLDQQHDFNRFLNLNIKTGAFYPWTTTAATVRTNGMVALSNPVASSTGATKFYYLTTDAGSGTVNFTFAINEDTTYKDWTLEVGSGGTDYDSYFIVGFYLHGESARKFQANYIIVQLEEQANASLYLQGLWDYARTNTQGKVTTVQQCYLDSGVFSRHRRKLKLRGHGKALQLYFYSETGKPFTCEGWSVWESSNASH